MDFNDSNYKLIPEEERKELMIYAQNKLVETPFHFNRSQMDVLFYLLHIVRDDVSSYSFPLKNLNLISGQEWSNSQLAIIAREIYSLPYVERASSRRWKVFNLFQSLSYDDGIVKVVINPEAMPLFMSTKENYTCLMLQSALQLNTQYAKRLYLLLSKWKSAGKKRYEISVLKEMLGIPEVEQGEGKGKRRQDVSSFSRIDNFKKMIDETVKEISNKSDIHLECEWLKQAKSVIAVNFVIKSNKAHEAIPDNTTFEDSPEKVEALRAFKLHQFTDDEALEMWSRGLTTEKFQSIIKRVSESISKKSREGEVVHEPLQYLKTVLRSENFLAPSGQKVDVAQLEKRHEMELYQAKRKEAFATMSCAYGLVPDEQFLEMFKANFEKFSFTLDEFRKAKDE